LPHLAARRKVPGVVGRLPDDCDRDRLVHSWLEAKYRRCPTQTARSFRSIAGQLCPKKIKQLAKTVETLLLPAVSLFLQTETGCAHLPPGIHQWTSPAARGRAAAENRGCTSSAMRQGRDTKFVGGDVLTAGRNGITTGRRKRFPKGIETGQDGDELKTQKVRDGQNQEALRVLCAKSIVCAWRVPSRPHPIRLRAEL